MSLNFAEKRVIHKTYDVISAVIDAHLVQSAANLSVPRSIALKAKQDAFKHHLEHLRILRFKQNHVDPYKITAWYGFFLAKYISEPGCSNSERSKSACLLAIISFMNHMLTKEDGGIALDAEWMMLLHLYACNDGRDDDHGVGMNGLYMAFATARRAIEIKRGIRHDLPK